MQPRNLSMGMGMGMGLAAALMCGVSEATQDTPEADREADEALAREMEARRRLEQDQQERAQALARQCLYYPIETLHIPKMPTYQPEPRRRSKRAQRVKERGWR